jgi:hypothetical protein
VMLQEKAHRAMDELWKIRHRSSDLMGTVLNIHSGDWVRRDSGVGAGIDSYYEYCLKAYILLGDERYLGRFNKVCHVMSCAVLHSNVIGHASHVCGGTCVQSYWPKAAFSQYHYPQVKIRVPACRNGGLSCTSSPGIAVHCLKYKSHCC